MPRDTNTMSPRERQDHLLAAISSSRFLNKRGPGNDVPFFICPYPVAAAVDMEAVRGQLIKQLSNRGVNALDINLYDLSVSMLQDRGIWDQLIEQETNFSKDELKELLQNVLDPEQHLVPEIARKLQQSEFDVLFLSGVGEVFPYIRSHNVLNNLQSTAKEQPTVIFFPGDYTNSLASGASLDLFGMMHDDKYYRAFDIFNFEV